MARQMNNISSDFSLFSHSSYSLFIITKMAIKLFITGTDTDVGKTFISALLCKRWSAGYWKPIQTGLESDPGDTKTVSELLGSSLVTSTPALEYQKPLSPWRAVELENREAIDIKNISVPKELEQNKEVLIIEGAGGVFVPITESLITTDLIQHFDCPVIVVARSELGTLNHTLLTIEHLKNRGVKVIGVVLNGDLNNDNSRTLEAFGVKILFQIPRASTLDEVEHLVPDLKDVYKI